MLNDTVGLKKIYLAAGYTDLHRGIDGLATMIRFRFQLDPYDKNTLFLARKQTVSRVFFGKVIVFCFSTRDWTMVRSADRVPQKKLWKYHLNSMRC